jgi:hypothetical protein
MPPWYRCVVLTSTSDVSVVAAVAPNILGGIDPVSACCQPWVLNHALLTVSPSHR